VAVLAVELSQYLSGNALPTSYVVGERSQQRSPDILVDIRRYRTHAQSVADLTLDWIKRSRRKWSLHERQRPVACGPDDRPLFGTLHVPTGLASRVGVNLLNQG
jgi:hypothetical protein